MKLGFTVAFLFLLAGIAQGDLSEPHSSTGPIPPANITQGRVYSSGAQRVVGYHFGDILIPGVPAYLWWRGCGPTAAGMVVGYYHAKGYNLLPPAYTPFTAEENMISSQGNYADYCLPIDSTVLLADKSELPAYMRHPDDSVADFMYTSQSARGLMYGWSYYSDVPRSVVEYVKWISAGGVVAAATNNANFASLWNAYRAEIDAKRPVVLLVDSDGNGGTDHFVTGVGYNAHTTPVEYAAYNTWDSTIHWYPFLPMNAGTSFGVYGATFFTVQAVDNVAVQGVCRALNDAAQCQSNSQCEWCSIYQSYGQCYRRGLCQVARATCAGRVGFTCLQQGAPEYLWCSGTWFNGLMPCHLGNTCYSSTLDPNTTPC